MSVATFDVEDTEAGSQQRLERRRELNRKAQRRFRTRRNQARKRQIEQDNPLATVWPNDWPWSSSSSMVSPLAVHNQTMERMSSFGLDEPPTADILGSDAMPYPTIPQEFPPIESPPLAPLQSPAMIALADSQPPLPSYSAALTQDGTTQTAAAQQVYPSWVPGLSGVALAEPQEIIMTDTGSPCLSGGSSWPSSLDMTPFQSLAYLSSCTYTLTTSFSSATSPVTTTEATVPIDSQEALNWGDMENL